MHEIAMVTSLFEIINAAVDPREVAAVSRVHLKMGELSALEPLALTACFEVVAQGTLVQGAQLVIETLPLTGRCAGCGAQFRITDYRFICPDCGSGRIDLVGGKELYLDSLEVTVKGECYETVAA